MHRAVTTIELRFDPSRDGERIARQLSAIVQVGDELWLACDEGCTIERLTREGDGYGHHASFALGEYLDLPSGASDEIDIEGLEYDAGYLWIIGSHSARRKKPKRPDDDLGAAVDSLARIHHDDNRYVLARIPLVRGADGAHVPARQAHHPDDAARRLRAAGLAGGRDNELVRAVRRDDHLGRFLDVPGKDNGFDVEGFAMADGRAYVGLRGPVLGGWAVVLAMKPRRHTGSSLRLRRVGPARRRYDKLFLDLHGLGVRELCIDGQDLLALAGPTMAVDGMCAVYRWRGALTARGDTLIERDRLERVLELPYGRGDDETVEHPEGLAILQRDGRRELVVLYDAPAEHRLRGPATVVADVYPLTAS